jgi:hypothetical protein
MQDMASKGGGALRHEHMCTARVPSVLLLLMGSAHAA